VRVGFIGSGHIARALAKGWHASGAWHAPDLCFFDAVEARSRQAAREFGGQVALTPRELVEGSDVVVVAVPPSEVDAALLAVKDVLGERGLLSVAAGVTLERLRSVLPDDVRVGRLMPSVAAEVGLGVFLFAEGSTGPLATGIRAAFDAIGTTVDLEEEVFDVATAVSGCMPGFLGYIIEAFTTAGRRGGLDAETSRRLAVAAAYGSAAAIADEGDPVAVITAVSTPGGMTEAGLAVLESKGLDDVIEAAVRAATARAKELARPRSTQ
jgi:pyrroline-5-carboxylate reductase